MEAQKTIESVKNKYGFIPFNDIRGVFADKYSKLQRGLTLCDLLNKASQGLMLNK